MRFWPLLLLTGCTDRLLEIRSEPPEADVYVDGKRVGKTPCAIPFTWYGDRELVLEKEGYRSRTEILRVRAPWWQWPVLDFITDVILPIRLVDRRFFFFPLAPQRPDPRQAEEIRRRAEELRRQTREKP